MHPNQSISISTGTFFKAVLIVLGLWFLWYLRDVVAIFVVAIMLASIIDPFADWFAARRIPRGLAVLIVYTVLLALTSVIIIVLIPIIIEQSVQLLQNFSSSYAGVAEWIAQFQSRHQFFDNLT